MHNEEKRIVPEHNTWIEGSMEDLIKSEFYKSIKYEPEGKVLLDKLKGSIEVKVIIGYNIASLLVLEVTRNSDKIKCGAFEYKRCEEQPQVLIKQNS